MSKTIMIVDDSKSVRAVIGMTLKMAGYDTVIAEDGQQALDYMTDENNQKIDLIVTDVNMPNMDGITLIKELKKIKEFSTIPVCILTTETEQEKMDQESDGLNDAWIMKPVQPAHVLDIVGGLLDK